MKFVLATNQDCPQSPLGDEDYQSIINKSSMLNTHVVNYSMNSLKKTSTALYGFQPTDFHHLPGNSYSAVESPFVNIFYLASVSHFVCVSDVFL